MTMDHAVARLAVSPAARRAAHTLIHLPMGTVDHVAQAQGLSPYTMYPAVRELAGVGLVASRPLRVDGGQANRYWFTQEALERMGLHHDSWHLPGELAHLLDRFPLTHRLYQAATSIESLGRFGRFDWFSGLALDAAVTYEQGWVALLWSGRLETEGGLVRRLTRLGHDMVAGSITDDPAWPTLLLWVVDDPWQREVVLRAARRFRLQDQMAIWCVADGTVSWPRSPQISRGGLHQPLVPRSLGTWTWDRRIAASLWHPSTGPHSEAMVRVAAEWPGCRTSLVQAATGEGDRKRTERGLRLLRDQQWLRCEKVKGVGRHSITSRALNALARLDGTSNGRAAMRRHLPPWERRGVSQSHEDQVMDVMGRFMALGLAVAAGWRSWEHMGAHGAIKPDGMVRLTQSPYGPGWHYIELEQSARRTQKLANKMRGYASDRRQDDWPVLVVVWDNEAERILHELGRERRIRMITTTRRRLADHGAVGSAAIWSMYGLPAPLG